MWRGPCLIGGTPSVEEVPHGPGYLAGLAEGSGAGTAAALAQGHGLRLPGRAFPLGPQGGRGNCRGNGVRCPGGHAFRGEAGPGLLAPAGGERLGVGGGPGGAVAAGAQAGAALHHRWASGSTRSHPTGLPSGGVAAVCGARGAVEPGAGAGQRPDPLGGRPEAGVRGGEPGGGSQGPGGFEGGLGFAVPGGGGPVGWGLGGLFAVLRIPQGALAVLAEHQADGKVHSGDSAGDEGEGSGRRPILPTSFPARERCTSSFTWVTGFSPYLGSERQAASRSEHLAAQRVLGGEGDAGEDASGAVCPPYTNALTHQGS